MMSSADILDDSWPHTHGTPDGFDNDCRTVHCPAGEQYGLSCKTAKQLSRSDFQYQKLARTGATVPEIADALGLIGTGPATAAATKKQAGKRNPTPAPQPDAGPTETADAVEVGPIVTEVATVEVGELAAPESDVVEPAATADEPGAPTSREIRAWAREKGYDISTRGIVPTAIVEHYWDAHGLLNPTSALDDQLPVNNAAPQETAAEQAGAPAETPADQPPVNKPADGRPDYGTMNLEHDLATTRTELDNTIGERDRARHLAARLGEELARSEEQRDRDRSARNLAVTERDRLADIAATDRHNLAQLQTALAAASAALHTTERALELVLQKWDEATRPGRPTIAIGGKAVVVEQFIRPPGGGASGVAMAAALPAIVRSAR